jgi:phosphoglycerol transferase MdoB-like AlkP superfamily enzyme
MYTEKRLCRRIWQKIPKILRAMLTLAVGLTALFIVLHLAFWIAFDDSQSPLGSSDLVQALWLGMRFDLRIALVMLLPLFFVGWIKWLSPFETRWGRYFWTTYLSAVFAVVGLFYIVDFGHYAYLATRLDFTATRFLENAAISGEMVWESYPVVWITLAYLAVVALFVWLVNRLFQSLAVSAPSGLRWWQGTVVGFGSFLLVAIGIQSKFSQYPLRWSEAAFSAHPFAAQLAYNPVHYFFDTWKNGGVTYDINATRSYYDLMADYLGVEEKDGDALNYKRKEVPHAVSGKRPNVVIVIVESLASYKTSLSGNPLDPSPTMQRLADEGYYFKNFFTPSTGTARSVFTTITGMPDVELHGTSSRNPLIVDQHTIANDFEGYEKFYFLGGSASWGNIRGILSKNIDNLHIYEEGSYKSPRNDVWGISDINLFREANGVLEKQTKPFFAIIQTSGNHRPYTIPEDNYGFELKHPGDEEVRKYGFDNEGEYNAYRFMDHSIGHFMKLVRDSGYGDNTIFVFWGDHGIVGSAVHVGKAEYRSNLNLGSHRVPLVIWAPNLIKEPKVFDKVASEVDVLPTIASLAGQPYTATTLGRDLFDPKYDDKRYAFTISHSQLPLIGVVGKEFYFRMRSDGSDAGLHRIKSDTPMQDMSADYPEKAKEMETLTRAFYRTSQYMVHHNKREALSE